MTARRSLCAAVLASGLLLLGSARADDKETCASSAEQGQQLRDSGRLVDARAQFIACSRKQCPALVQEDCLRWLRDVENVLPTVVFRATDSRGRDVVGVRVDIDGRRTAERLEGRAITVDPGPRKVRFESRSGRTIEELVVVAEGEKTRTVVARFDQPLTVEGDPDTKESPAVDPGAPSRPIPTAAYVTGAVAAVGLLAFGAFELVGQSEYRSLRDGCGRTASCDESDVDATRAKFVAAGVSLGVGVVAAAVTAALILARGSEPPKRARAPWVVHF